ncbi:MAG: Gfo/Idh/MocA family oxidoreductase [Capsulimonadales bacterium]|nr:Gfo/Idh/MocA family oxidoreductase [Capsulimonadales bacterium]
MDTAVSVVPEGDEAEVKALRVGIIGCGGIAQTHIGYFKKFPGVSIVCGADIRQTALDHMRAAHGVELLYTDYNEMLQEVGDAVDAISVATPNGVHAPAAIAAMNAGKHVLCEKPMAMNAKEAQEMAAAAKANGVEFIIGFQHRYEPRSKYVRDLIESGAIGKVLYVRAQALRRRGIPNWGVFGRKELQGGGPMIDIGVHILETAHSLIGTPRPVTATGNTFTYLGNTKSDVKSTWPNWDHETYTVEDLAVGMIRFETGAMLTLESSFVAHIKEDVFNIQIFGEKGGVIWNTSETFTDYNTYMVNATPAFIPKWDMWEYKMRHFVEVVRDGRPNEAPAEHGVMVQKMLDGIYAAADAGKEVAID